MNFKTIIVAMCILLTATIAQSQTKKEIEKMAPAECPISSETSLITYSIEFQTSMDDSIVYKRAVHWYKTAIKSMRIETDKCQQSKYIEAKGECNYMYPVSKGQQAIAGRLKYTMKTYIENGKVHTEITRFNVKDVKYTPIEPWLDLQNSDYKYKYFLINIEEQMNDILSSHKAMIDVKYIKH